jgi:DNA-binding NtrC family response regulator
VVEKNLLNGKRILIVDDEPDILKTLEELLSMCYVEKASSFDKASELLENQSFDIAILDIMGVDGYKLLEIANEKKVIAIMLTAHAFSLEDTAKSYKKEAASYIPKEEISNIRVFLEDVLEAKEKGKNSWWRWLGRFTTLYDKKFGPDWKDSDKEFWEKLEYWG